MTRPSLPPAETLDDVLVTRMHASGAGIAAAPDGLEILIPGALPGARGTVRFRRPQPGGRRGLAESWTERSASPDADPGRCPHVAGEPPCGGCPMGGLKYARELALKTELLVVEPLAAAGFDARAIVAPALGQPEGCERGFRNKAVLYPGIVDGRGRFGHFAARSQTLVPAEDCPQTPAWMAGAARALAPLVEDGTLAPAPESAPESGVLRCLLMREAPGTGERMLALVVRTDAGLEDARARILAALEPAGLSTVLVNLHPAAGSGVFNFAPGATRVWSGAGTVEASLMGLGFALGPQTFLQVNTPQTPVLYERALAAAEAGPGDAVLDLYCGVGTITLLAASRAARAWGVERVEASIDRARENAAANGLANAGFTADAVERFLDRALAEGFPEGFEPTKVIVDPAYQGLAGGAAEALARLVRGSRVSRIAYVSCNPKSFARDAKTLAAAGMRLVRVEPVDLFPGAMHLEVVGTFVRD